ncbi:type II toxin-antitoxin system HicB family antitoxin [Thalassotalea sp. LPB0316]|uniref:type II toxin-antitoxin system HicB family antitoxin n=1 Tax=Thalassotalea sp. LPB0316 TaxID=2769490 RepID=UPI0018666978|nr:type II toxin-antitoxin system HicB family antitoxin [Thalassotalea sp. LPB0316]QOL24850.1 type II toxin-antitoxin system HicB family antitoxin [Thalassotalea sp. LPB0316]
MNYPFCFLPTVDNDTMLVSVPDLPGCQISAKNFEEGFEKIKIAIGDHLSILAEYGEAIPHSTDFIELQHKFAQKNVLLWGMHQVDITPYLGKSQKINVTLPELLIRKIDDRVGNSGEYPSRSGFIAQACIKELNQ